MEFSLAPHVITYVYGFPITSTLWVTVLVSAIIVAVFLIGRLRMREVPRGLQVFLEMMVEGSHNLIKDSTGSEKAANRLHPFGLTVFLLFLFGNLLSFIPGLPSLTFNGEPLYRTATTDYNLVLILAMFFLVIVQAVNIITGGIFAYFKRFINFSSPLNFILGFFEIIGECAKLVSISFRFFGNAFAAEVLLAVLLFIFPYVLPLPFMAILLLSSVVQPAVFALLVMIYVQMAIVARDEIKTPHTSS
ncbi:MAG: FoF1 ATP synthase subunit a [bacterium]|nr:FoF1 ATP synthase subunit a [bacterium]